MEISNAGRNLQFRLIKKPFNDYTKFGIKILNFRN